MNLSPITIEQLHNVPLFNAIDPKELSCLLKCLDSQVVTYPADTFICHQEEPMSAIFIVLEGSVSLLKEDLRGNTSLLLKLKPLQLFGESIVATPARLSPVTIVADEDCTLLKIPHERILRPCHHSCGFHYQIAQNMMYLLGQRNFALNEKIDLLLLKGIREKLIMYLLMESKKQQARTFHIDLNRTQLAAYLNVSRPSMCRELALLKEEGLIDYYQNTFQLITL